jgi:hypothetical protein
MGLFSKDEKIPAVPKAPTLPELPKAENANKQNLPELPSFPSDSKNENLNQQMVKSAVLETPTSTNNEINVSIPENTSIREEKMPSIADRRSAELPPIPTVSKEIPRQPKLDVETPVSMSQQMQQMPKSSLNEPIFIRLDKFQASQKSLESIKEKIAKVEITLKKIEEVKVKEDAELKGWLEDINQVKSKIAEIDNDIFNQI